MKKNKQTKQQSAFIEYLIYAKYCAYCFRWLSHLILKVYYISDVESKF